MLVGRVSSVLISGPAQQNACALFEHLDIYEIILLIEFVFLSPREFQWKLQNQGKETMSNLFNILSNDSRPLKSTESS